MTSTRIGARALALLPSLLGGFLLCVTESTCAHAPVESPFTLKHIGPNVWAAIDNSDAREAAGVNAGFVIGDDGVLVIDTFASADAASRLLAEIRQLTKLPIRFVINTHYHLDHVAGNGVFAEAGAVVLAQRNVRTWIHTENRRLLGDGLRSAGRGEITPEQTAMIEAFVAPTVVYGKSVDLYLGLREIHVRSFPGHTGGDSVVLIPDAKIAFCGDLLFRQTMPNLIDASTKPWIETLDVLANSEPDYTFVPGHGDVGHVQDLKTLRDYLATLRNLVSAETAQGKSGDALAEALMPELTGKYGQWNAFTYFAKASILQTEAELSGKKKVPRAAEGAEAKTAR
jgi:glyoxylase-like metal-dependent hydrolase (beta-lactamase superfamily II)